VFCCKLQTPWDRRPFEKRSGNAVQSPRQRSTIAENVVTTQQVRSEIAVGTPRWPTAIARTAITQRLRGVYGDSKAFAYDSTEFSKRLHSVHAAFLAIPKRLHYDSTEFSRRLLFPHLNKQINNTHTYMYMYIYAFVRDRHVFH
jgi:hypothetical protein